MKFSFFAEMNEYQINEFILKWQSSHTDDFKVRRGLLSSYLWHLFSFVFFLFVGALYYKSLSYRKRLESGVLKLLVLERVTWPKHRRYILHALNYLHEDIFDETIKTKALVEFRMGKTVPKDFHPYKFLQPLFALKETLAMNNDEKSFQSEEEKSKVKFLFENDIIDVKHLSQLFFQANYQDVFHFVFEEKNGEAIWLVYVGRRSSKES